MHAAWESTFAAWAQSPSETEAAEILNAETAVKRALDADAFLRSNSRVFAQGSYRNRVNVRRHSDVDLCVQYTGNAFFDSYPAGQTRANFGNIDGDLDYASFKAKVFDAMVRYFGHAGVTRGNKAIDVHANTYRVDADVVPVFQYRSYAADGTFQQGVKLVADDGTAYINWPEQHYANGVAKNNATARAFKGVVRILKKLKDTMKEQGIASAQDVPGFLIESMVWNVPDLWFVHDNHDDRMQGVLAYLWSNTREWPKCITWCEVNGIKLLFPSDVKRAIAHRFIDAAWTRVGIRS